MKIFLKESELDTLIRALDHMEADLMGGRHPETITRLRNALRLRRKLVDLIRANADKPIVSPAKRLIE
jgi:hypothetical protein